MRTLQILFLIDSLGEGGSERSLAELLPYLTKAEIECKIICLNRRNHGVQKDVEDQGINVRFIKASGRVQRIRELRSIIQAENPDVLHTTLFESNLLGRLASIGFPFPVLSSLVNTSYDPVRVKDANLTRNKLRVVQKIDSWTSRYCTTHFHAVSHAAKSAAVRDLRIAGEKITVVERGREWKRLGQQSLQRRSEARRMLGLQDQDSVILNVGRHEFQKGQSILLKTVAQLKPSHPKLVVLIAGRYGNYSDELIELARTEGLQESVHFLGYRDDIPELLAAADLFVFPSLFEGLPGAVLEAMALGLPIIASDIPSIREVTDQGRNALLFAAASVTELAKAIHTLLIDRELAGAFGKRSREIFQERYTIERCASRMIELYQQVSTLRK